MLRTRALLRLMPFRAQFSSTSSRMSSESDKPAPVKQENTRSEGQDYFVRPTRIPSNLEKKVLVWTGKFKSIDEIPSRLPPETMDRANSKARIRVANYMILATIIACIGYAISGKRAAARGESVHKMNLDWHKAMEGQKDK